ncbi:MAG: type II secretion system F family protein [archaeon]
MIPFVLFPEKVMKTVSLPFIGLAQALKKIFPFLDMQLKHADIEFTAEEYLAMLLFNLLVYFAVFSVLFIVLLERFVAEYITLGLGLSVLFCVLIALQILIYPAMRVKKKVRDIENNLVFALRTMLIQVRSGVTLFNAMEIVAEGDFGLLGQEFRKLLSQIKAGEHQNKVLQDFATRTPSQKFRNILWQIVNGLKGGAEVASVLQESVSTAVKDQMIEINKYGNQLRLLSLMYMMVGVVIPSLGLTFLIILSSFPKIQINESMLWILLGLIILMNFMYLGMVKSQRPALGA